MTDVINFKNIYLKYGDKEILNDFSLDIKAGEKVCLFGPSGIGKSSILSLVMGFTKADSGTIAVKGMSLNHSNINRIRQELLWLPQNTGIIGSGKVIDVLNHPFSFATNKKNKPSDELVTEYLSALGLDESILENTTENLSGGEKQRIGIIICKLLKKAVLLIDEPTSQLDKASIDKVIEFILKDKTLTVLSCSHDEEWVKNCETVIRISG